MVFRVTGRYNLLHTEYFVIYISFTHVLTFVGGAGVFGALSYAGFTSAGVSPRNTVLIMNVIPFTFGIR